MYCACVVAALHPLWNWLLIYHLGLGVHGAAFATSASQCLLCLTLLTYILVARPHVPGTWPGFSCLAFAQLRPFVSLALSGAAMTCVEVRCLFGTVSSLQPLPPPRCPHPRSHSPTPLFWIATAAVVGV